MSEVKNAVPCVVGAIPVVSFAGGLCSDDVPQELINFCELMVKAHHTRMPDLYYISQFEIRLGKKFYKIDRIEIDKETGELLSSRSAICSIDFDGNIFKSASYKTVAKGIRGNIFNNNGSNAIDPYGFVRYLR